MRRRLEKLGLNMGFGNMTCFGFGMVFVLEKTKHVQPLPIGATLSIPTSIPIG